MTYDTEHMRRLLELRASVDKAIAMEAARQGVPVPTVVPARHVGYVVVPAPELRHAAAQIAAAAERWGSDHG